MGTRPDCGRAVQRSKPKWKYSSRLAGADERCALRGHLRKCSLHILCCRSCCQTVFPSHYITGACHFSFLLHHSLW
ncbi:hypothetical protein AXF42_Ash006737 [Apostasia shenzhenica]|uniref:Uncharacterized protein n=1 Tax=Apostasia shenzhenica TaxID=1088818 RepID=A0A2I0AJ35_9ASPA|nr:hypothetical protein AXF42_Ash006737 [Apostasia shenzhenica]